MPNAEIQMLSVTVENQLQPLAVNEWQELFAGHCDPAELIDLVDRLGMDGFKFQSVVVRKGAVPVLLIPIFQTRYPVSTSLDGQTAEIVESLADYLPDLFRPRILGVGFVEGEWGQIGVNRNFDLGTVNKAWDLAMRQLEKLAAHCRCQAILLWNFSSDAVSQIPDYWLRRFVEVSSQPYCELDIGFASLEDYLKNCVDKDMRRYLKRVARNAEGIIMVERTSQAPTERIYQLYTQLLSRVETSFGMHKEEYFAQATRTVPGAQYVLYKKDDRVIGFEMLIENQQQLVSKYFAMDAEEGPQYKLYFLSWLENIKYCLDKGLNKYYLGAAAEGLKVKLGASTQPSSVLFRHRNPLLHYAFGKFKHVLAYEPESQPESRLPVNAKPIKDVCSV